MNECCPPKRTYIKKSFIGVASIFSASGAAGLAGIGCLSCIPFLGAALTTSSFAVLLDDNLLVLQLGLITSSAALSYIYFRKVGSFALQRIMASATYLALAGNAVFFQNRILAVALLFILVAAHALKRKSADLKLLYFKGCPTYPQLKLSLDRAGIVYETVDLESLRNGNSLRRYSSPALIFREELLYGTQLSSESMSCSYSSKEDLENAVTRAMILSGKSRR